jgi:hypothetical protein
MVALPRTLDRLSWLGFFSVVCITLSGILAMIGAGLNPTPCRIISAAVPTTFYNAFFAITNPVRAYLRYKRPFTQPLSVIGLCICRIESVRDGTFS